MTGREPWVRTVAPATRRVRRRELVAVTTGVNGEACDCTTLEWNTGELVVAIGPCHQAPVPPA